MADKTKYKLILLGNIDVGKTSLVIRYVENDFAEGKAANFDTKEKTVNFEGRNIQLCITDTAGQERFRTLTSSYYRNADAIIIVYDITNRESFQDVEGYIKEGERYGASTSQKFLVGNKIDKASDRQITPANGEQLAQRHKIPFFETSAKTGENVEKLFLQIIKTLSLNSPQKAASTGPDIVIPTTKTSSEGKGCC
eukprot:TRINITY_DN1184_c0_g1_i1.p1 TRINITY_DN1184_c0_g1~~TRINITY_DN1184_c0_g1_i1.p1  ORF type:complete len:196 (+),score=24.35 TRINITY_DN1184_c0_g1_i1:120-707(+)